MEFIGTLQKSSFGRLRQIRPILVQNSYKEIIIVNLDGYSFGFSEKIKAVAAYRVQAGKDLLLLGEGIRLTWRR